jgi:hypothetical protein
MQALGNLLGASMRFPCQTAHRSCNTEIALFQLTIWPAHNRHYGRSAVRDRLRLIGPSKPISPPPIALTTRARQPTAPPIEMLLPVLKLDTTLMAHLQHPPLLRLVTLPSILGETTVTPTLIPTSSRVPSRLPPKQLHRHPLPTSRAIQEPMLHLTHLPLPP